MWRWTLGVLLVLVGCVGSEDTESASVRRCEQLRDHLVDLQVGQIHIATGIDREAHRRAMVKSLGTDFMSSCGRLTESQIDCALETRESVAIAACAR